MAITLTQLVKGFRVWRAQKKHTHENVPDYLWKQLYQADCEGNLSFNSVLSTLSISRKRYDQAIEKLQCDEEVVSQDNTDNLTDESATFIAVNDSQSFPVSNSCVIRKPSGITITLNDIEQCQIIRLIQAL